MSVHDPFRSLAVSSLDFGLSASERAKLNDHLAGCAECRRFTEGIRGDAIALRAREVDRASDAGTSPAVRERVLAAATTVGPMANRRLLVEYALLVILVALLLAVAGIIVASGQPRLEAEVQAPSPSAGTALVVTATIDTSGRLPPEPEYCLIGFGHHSSPDCRIGLAAGDGSIWVDAGQGVVRVDPTTNRIISAIPLGSDPRDLVFMGGSLFVATEAGTIDRIDPARDEVASTIEAAPGSLAAMAPSPDDELWVTVPSRGEVVRVDPVTGSVLARVAIGGEPFDVAVKGDFAWVSDRVNNQVTRVDLTTDRVAGVTPMLGFEPRDIEVTPAGLWVVGQSEVAELDPGTGTILRQLPGSANANIGSGASGLWAMTTVNARLHLLDITNGSDIAWVDIDPTEITNEGTTAVTEALGSTWVVRYGSPALVRIGPP